MIKTIALATALLSGFLLASEAFGAPAKAAKADAAPAGMTYVAQCKNGKKYYHATGERRGACSGAGGVEVWADGTAPKSSKGRSALR